MTLPRGRPYSARPMTKSNLGLDECLALLRDPSLRTESIVEEIECAGAGGIRIAA